MKWKKFQSFDNYEERKALKTELFEQIDTLSHVVDSAKAGNQDSIVLLSKHTGFDGDFAKIDSDLKAIRSSQEKFDSNKFQKLLATDSVATSDPRTLGYVNAAAMGYVQGQIFISKTVFDSVFVKGRHRFTLFHEFMHTLPGNYTHETIYGYENTIRESSK